MAQYGEDTEIETLTTTTPSPTSPERGPGTGVPIRRVEEEMDEESRDSSTIDSDEEENVQYIRRNYPHSSDEESYTDSFSGEIACCFSAPKCCRAKDDLDSEEEKISKSRYYSHMSLIFTSVSLFICASVLWAFIGYLLPACFCPDVFIHLRQLPFSASLVLFCAFLYFCLLFFLTYKVCRSILWGLETYVFAYTVMAGLTAIASLIINCLAIYKAGGWTNYIIYRDSFYSEAGVVVLNPQFMNAIQAFSGISQSENLEAVYKKLILPEALSQIEAIERVGKWYILGGWFIYNFLIVCNIYYLMYYRTYLPPAQDILAPSSDSGSVRSRRSQKSLRSNRSSKSLKKHYKTSTMVRSVRQEKPPSYRDLSPPRSDYTSVTKRSAYSMKRAPPRHISQNQSFAQAAFTSRSRNSLAAVGTSYHYMENASAPRPEYTNTGSRRNVRNIKRTEDLLLP